MTDTFELTRRKALIGLGSIGAASAGAGLGTSALFSDQESFSDNSIQAGALDLFVDYVTTVDQDGVDTGSTTNNGQIQGDGSAVKQYAIKDAKPGDSGFLAFCPKLVDNPGHLWVGTTGLTDYENGQTEPEASADDSGGGAVGNPNDGAGAGELSEHIQVTVSYCEATVAEPSGPDDFETIRELNNPDDYSLSDLARDLRTGFRIDGDLTSEGTDSYPGSSDATDQQGPCICISWEIPASVGNEIQTDAVEFDIAFAAVQARNNPASAADNPFVDAVLTSDATGGIRETDNWITAKVSAGPTTVVEIDLDGEVYGNGDSVNQEVGDQQQGAADLPEWPSNPNSYFMEANIDVDTDGIDEAANDDDFRVGFAAANSGARANAIANSTAGASGNGGYIRRNTGGTSAGASANRTDVAAEDVPGFSAHESADQLTYTLVLDWAQIAADSASPTAQLSSAPTAIQVNEIFGGDGGEGVATNESTSDDGRESIDNVTGGSGTLTF